MIRNPNAGLAAGWTVAIHLLASMMVAGGADVKIGQPDDGVVHELVYQPVARSRRSANPAADARAHHGGRPGIAGDAAAPAGPCRGRKVEITTLVHMHSSLLVAYLALLIGLLFAADRGATWRLGATRRAARPIATRPPSVPRNTSPGYPPPWSPFTAGAAGMAATAAPWASMGGERAQPQPPTNWTHSEVTLARLRMSGSSHCQPSDGSTNCNSATGPWLHL